MAKHTVAEFDVLFLRDLKHRLRMALRAIEKRERQLMKEHRREQASSRT